MSAAQPARRALDGVLLLDKPAGMTSNAALQTARRLLNARKAGHTGTLDPLASGLLPLTFGEATKFAQMLLDADKVYEAGVRLGIETDSGDADGKVLSTKPVCVGEADLHRALARFRGEIEQIPPMHSALKRDGKPLYEYARAGIDIARAPRRVKISALDLLAFAGDRFTIHVACSKGTYIRVLATDIGAVLGCGAHLDALRRTHVGTLDLRASVTLEALEATPPAQRDALLAPVDTLAMDFPRLDLDPAAARQILQGQPLPLPHGKIPGDRVRLYGPDGFLGLGQWKEDGRLWPKRLVSIWHPPGNPVKSIIIAGDAAQGQSKSTL
ncbi:MAG: tRNA pseudouridine(55) synthase TruB [Azoarcus sp.]|jgi:tRNA pseudouridine55 synthase|nr:tRNA pseudouridine(55) synthase TruB [Azoarcus sp.]